MKHSRKLFYGGEPGEENNTSDAPAAETASEVKDEATSEGEATADAEA